MRPAHRYDRTVVGKLHHKVVGKLTEDSMMGSKCRNGEEFEAQPTRTPVARSMVSKAARKAKNVRTKLA